MKKKLAIVVNKANFFLSHRINIALSAQKEGYEVHLISDGMPDDISKITQKGIIFHQTYFSRTYKNIFVEMRTIIELFLKYKKIKPYIVHHVTIKPIVYGNIVCKLISQKRIVNSISGLGYIFVNKNFKNRILKFFVLKLYKLFFNSKSVRVIVQNEEEKGFLLKNKVSNEHNLRLVPGAGVNTSKFCPPDSFSNRNIIVFAARMIKEKGVEDLVNAVEKLHSMKYNLKLILLGDVDKDYPTHIRKTTLEKWDKKTFIDWHGHTDNVVNFYQIASIICMPSYYSEGVPKSLIEAAAVGKPIITTDMPGCRSIVKNKFNGLLVKPKNVNGLTSSIKYLLDNPKICSELGKNGRIHALRTFDEKRIINLTLSIYEEIG